MELNKIYCIDCLEFLKTIPDESVDLVVTDPPYNISQKNNVTFDGRIIKKNFGDWDFKANFIGCELNSKYVKWANSRLLMNIVCF